MEVYFEDVKILRLFGVQIFGDDRKCSKGLKLFNIILLLVMAIQSFIIFMSEDESVLTRTHAISVSLFSVQAFIKIVNFMVNKNRMLSIIAQLNFLFMELNRSDKKSFINSLTQYRRALKFMVGVYIVSLWLFIIATFGETLIYYKLSGEWEPHFPLLFYWPYELKNLYFLESIYNIYCSNLIIIIHIAMDQFILLIYAQLIAHFRQLKMRIVASIENSLPSILRKNLRQYINDSCKLFEISDSLKHCYSFPFLINIISLSFVACFVGFFIIVSLGKYQSKPSLTKNIKIS